MPVEHLLATCGGARATPPRTASTSAARCRCGGGSRRPRRPGSAASGCCRPTFRRPSRSTGWSGIRAMLDDNGIVDLELEGIPYWWDDGPRREESDRIRHALLRAAEMLGARHIKVTPDGDDAPWDREPGPRSSPSWRRRPTTPAPGWASSSSRGRTSRPCMTGLRLVDDAGHDAAGVVIDVWHIERAHTPVADLASVPLHRIIGVELNDADSGGRRDAVRGHGAPPALLR